MDLKDLDSNTTLISLNKKTPDPRIIRQQTKKQWESINLETNFFLNQNKKYV